MRITHELTFLNEPRTSDHEGSSGEAATGSTTISTRNWTRQHQPLDLERLTARSRTIHEGMFQDHHVTGYTLREIAASRGKPVSWVNEALEWLNAEGGLQSGSFFPLTETEFEGLKNDIAENGVRVPIFVGQHKPIIDGLNRWAIACLLGIEQDVPIILVEGLSRDEEQDLSWKLNTHRRQLTFVQKEQLVEVELRRDWNRSDRGIAAICGVAHRTVGQIRKRLRLEELVYDVEPTPEELDSVSGVTFPDAVQKPLVASKSSSHSSSTIDVPLTESRVDQRGRTHTVKIDSDPKPRVAKKIGHVTCCHGAVHDLLHDGEVYTAVYVRD